MRVSSFEWNDKETPIAEWCMWKRDKVIGGGFQKLMKINNSTQPGSRLIVTLRKIPFHLIIRNISSSDVVKSNGYFSRTKPEIHPPFCQLFGLEFSGVPHLHALTNKYLFLSLFLPRYLFTFYSMHISTFHSILSFYILLHWGDIKY